MLVILRRFIILLNIIAAISCVALAAKFIAFPVYAEKVYAQEYKYLMRECDTSMRNHLIAKNMLKFDPNEENINTLSASELELMICHKYDLLRKKLITMGLTPNDLSRIGLEVIESKIHDLDVLVEIHEFKY